MPKPYGFTKNAKIEMAIKARAGKTFKTRNIAFETGATSQAVTAMIRQLNANGWRIESVMNGRNTYYRVLTIPQEAV